MTPRSSRSTWAAIAALYFGLALVYNWPLLASIGSGLPSDTGDPGLVTWILWWNAHAVPLTAHWWDAPMFAPVHGALALSETLLGITPLTTPLHWAGVSPIVVYNVAFLLSFPAAALAAHALAYRLTGRHDAAFIAGLAFGFSPYRASQMPHLQMQWTCWLALGLLALHRFLDERRWRDLGLLALCWVLNGLTTGYFFIFFAVLTALWLVWFVRRWRDWAALLVTLSLASLVIVPLFVAYARYQSFWGLSRTVTEIEGFSADLRALWVVSSHAWLPSHWTLSSRPEGELYPGLTILVLVALGLVAGWRARRVVNRRRVQIVLVCLGVGAAVIAALAAATGGWRVSIAGLVISVSRPHKMITVAVWLLAAAVITDRRFTEAWRRRSTFVFYVIAAVVMLLFALGPTARAFDARFMYKAPYSWLMELPGGDAVRVPARFGMLLMLCLAQAAAIAFGRLARPGVSKRIAIAVAAAVALEGWVPRMPMAPVPPAINLSGFDAKAPVFELPLWDPYSDTAAMLRSTRHGHPIVNGFSGYDPPHYGLLREGIQTKDAGVFPVLQRHGPLIVYVDRWRDPEDRFKQFMDGVPGATRVREDEIGTYYALPARVDPEEARTGSLLPIASITASSNQELAPLMTDGLWTTRWHTKESQSAGDEVVLSLERSAEMSRVELDMGRFGGDYPRTLRVAVSEGATPPVTIWESGMAGPAVSGALEDHNRTPLRIDLPPGTRGQRVVLTLAIDNDRVAWSIAEVRVFGR